MQDNKTPYAELRCQFLSLPKPLLGSHKAMTEPMLLAALQHYSLKSHHTPIISAVYDVHVEKQLSFTQKL